MCVLSSEKLGVRANRQDSFYTYGYFNALLNANVQTASESLTTSHIDAKAQEAGNDARSRRRNRAKRWSLERVVEMTEAYWKPKDETEREEKAILRRLPRRGFRAGTDREGRKVSSIFHTMLAGIGLAISVSVAIWWVMRRQR